MQYDPDPNAIYPNEKIKSVCYIKNVVTRPNIIVGDYTYYDDTDGAERFEEHVTHHYEFLISQILWKRVQEAGYNMTLDKLLDNLAEIRKSEIVTIQSLIYCGRMVKISFLETSPKV